MRLMWINFSKGVWLLVKWASELFVSVLETRSFLWIVHNMQLICLIMHNIVPVSTLRPSRHGKEGFINANLRRKALVNSITKYSLLTAASYCSNQFPLTFILKWFTVAVVVASSTSHFIFQQVNRHTHIYTHTLQLLITDLHWQVNQWVTTPDLFFLRQFFHSLFALNQ